MPCPIGPSISACNVSPIIAMAEASQPSCSIIRPWCSALKPQVLHQLAERMATLIYLEKRAKHIENYCLYHASTTTVGGEPTTRRAMPPLSFLNWISSEVARRRWVFAGALSGYLST